MPVGKYDRLLKFISHLMIEDYSRKTPLYRHENRLQSLHNWLVKELEQKDEYVRSFQNLTRKILKDTTHGRIKEVNISTTTSLQEITVSPYLKLRIN
jgi:hypothetical protein